MNRLLLAALLALPAAASSGASGDAGEHPRFAGKKLHARVSAGAAVRAGDVLWTSLPSDPVKGAFDKIFFQGVVQNKDIVFQASEWTAQGWGPWVEAELETADNGRFWAQVLLAGAAGARVRLRAVSKSGAKDNAELFDFETAATEAEEGGAGGRPRLQAESLSDSGGPAAAPQTVAPAEPPVLDRKQWGAKKATKPYEAMVPDRISIHHTEAFQAMSLNDAAQEMRIIQSFHQKGRGWIDIGYHFVIDGDGRIWQGRPIGVVGAHVKNKNDGNVGISLMGDFHAPKNNQPTPAQINALVGLLKWVMAEYNIPVDRIKGHRDQEDTSCPGDILYARLDEIRAKAASGAVAFKLPDLHSINLAFGPAAARP